MASLHMRLQAASPIFQLAAMRVTVWLFNGLPRQWPLLERMENMSADNSELFVSTPVRKAVISLVIPTVISQLIAVVYNMADTFFIGQIGDPNQVAAVSLCMPMFMFLTGLAN